MPRARSADAVRRVALAAVRGGSVARCVDEARATGRDERAGDVEHDAPGGACVAMNVAISGPSTKISSSSIDSNE